MSAFIPRYGRPETAFRCSPVTHCFFHGTTPRSSTWTIRSVTRAYTDSLVCVDMVRSWPSLGRKCKEPSVCSAPCWWCGQRWTPGAYQTAPPHHAHPAMAPMAETKCGGGTGGQPRRIAPIGVRVRLALLLRDDSGDLLEESPQTREPLC